MEGESMLSRWGEGGFYKHIAFAYPASKGILSIIPSSKPADVF